VTDEKDRKLEEEREQPEHEAASPAEPRRRRRRRKKPERAEDSGQRAEGGPEAGGAKTGRDSPTDDESAAEVEAAGDADEATAGDSSAEQEPAAEKPAKTPRARRRAAETAAPARKPARTRRPVDGTLVVRAKARYVRCAPRKARLVVDHIRGKQVGEARAILTHTPRAASKEVLKLLDSAVANAEHNHELVADELRVDQAYVDEGPTIKRYRPRALGRATQIRKRTSHMTITLRPIDTGEAGEH
jgi:large subunit ribosomal protein L22